MTDRTRHARTVTRAASGRDAPSHAGVPPFFGTMWNGRREIFRAMKKVSMIKPFWMAFQGMTRVAHGNCNTNLD